MAFFSDLLNALYMATVITYPLTDLQIRSCPAGRWALAAISRKKIVAIKEFQQLSPQVAYHLPIGAEEAAAVIRRWLETLPASGTVDELRQLGRIAIGMRREDQFLEV